MCHNIIINTYEYHIQHHGMEENMSSPDLLQLLEKNLLKSAHNAMPGQCICCECFVDE